jgi:hypothetical protein
MSRYHSSAKVLPSSRLEPEEAVANATARTERGVEAMIVATALAVATSKDCSALPFPRGAVVSDIRHVK